MKANELRIGNWIEDSEHFKGYFQVELIGSQTVQSLEYVFKYEDVSPILLTEEWLKKFGLFKMDICNYGFPKMIATLSRADKDSNWWRWFTRDGNYIGEKILYVHQLQNIHFALTGAELEIK